MKNIKKIFTNAKLNNFCFFDMLLIKNKFVIFIVLFSKNIAKLRNLLKKSLIFFIILITLTSCKGIAFENKKISTAQELKRSEAMIFVAEEKNKYEYRFGPEIWNLRSGDGKTNFKDYVVNNVKQFVEKIMKLKLAAIDLNIIIGSSDETKLKKAAEEYEALLNIGDFDYIGCNSEDILNAFKDYHLARLVIDFLTRNASAELSISEAKVIKVQYIVFDDFEDATKTRELLKVKGASFAYYAKSRSKETDIEMIIKRGDEMSTKFPEVFYLSTGQISDILQLLDKYYIFKCLNDYMVDETESRRNEILKSMKNDEFNENYARFDEEYQLKSNSTYWKEINLSEGNDCKIYKFEEIYYKYFPKSIKDKENFE